MSYIGNQPSSVAFVTDTFSGNGSTTAFTLSVAPASTTSVIVAVSGVLQDPSTYSVVGTTLTFTGAPPTGTSNISVRHLGIPATGVTNTAYRTVTEFTASSGQTTFSPPSYTVGFIDVYRNGVRLGTSDYTASNGTTVVLANGATVGDLISVESFQVSAVTNAIASAPGAVTTLNLDTANKDGTGAIAIPAGTTAQRPSSTTIGMTRYNTDTQLLENYTSTGWFPVAATSATSISYLVVAGGGAGANVSGNTQGTSGGGGAGGMVTGSVGVVPGVTYTITVGAGAARISDPSTVPSPSTGGASSIGSLVTTVGGGYGGSNNYNGNATNNTGDGFNGGSGGGCGSNGGGTRTGGIATSGQGSNGGQSYWDGSNGYGAGGGGGKGAVGGNGGASGGASGSGGAGLASSITGTSVTYAGGGGGGAGSGSSVGAGGSGGGGIGGVNSSGATAGNGGTNLGGGGGGGGCSGGIPGNGGSGIVVISYSNTYKAASSLSGTYTFSNTGGNYIYTFTGTGTISF